MTTPTRHIDEASFASEELLQRWCDRIGGEGLRWTGSAAHERIIAWIEDELDRIPGLAVRSDSYDILRWQPMPRGDLERAGSLRLGIQDIAVAGAVPYTTPIRREAPVAYLPPGEAITSVNAGGKIVLRDFPSIPLPYDALLGLGLHVTPDCDALRGQIWDRPGLADGILHDDLLAAGSADAAGLIIAFDLPREQVAGYFEPHKGTHYRVPAVYIGVDEREQLRQLATDGAPIELAVRGEVDRAPTRNVYATLPGQSAERIVLVTHTDGNTWVQENGIAALLALAKYFAAIPREHRHRTIEFASTSAHLHISREGAARYASQLDHDFDKGTVALALAIEHLGARELVPLPRADGPGRRLEFTGESEPILWAVGPSDALRHAVIDAVTNRGLERVVVAPGFGAAVDGQVPRIASFGGLGTYFHTHLVPTTSIITGPWSLWAPAFRDDAVDIRRLRQQALAAGDVVLAVDAVPREMLAGDYLEHRHARSLGAPTALETEPPETAAT
jgi:hypothetical protein